MYSVTLGKWSFSIEDGTLPDIYAAYKEHAVLVDEIDINDDEGRPLFISAGLAGQGGWPSVVIAQRYSPHGCGFDSGFLLVPQSSLLFVGAGENLSCYDLSLPQKLWSDYADIGFLGWRHYREFVLMSAELELSVWNTSGEKLWTTFVEPPWGYSIQGDLVELDIMGKKHRRVLATGKEIK